MDIIESLKSKVNIPNTISAIQAKGKTGVENAAKEYKNDRKIRNTQVGKLEDKTTDKGGEVKVSKIPIPFQRNIVKSASSFLFGNPVKLSTKDSESGNDVTFEKLTNLWDDLRMDSLLLNFCKAVKSETEATIVFYTKQEDSGVKVKARLLQNENGKVYPVFDEFGDLIVFAWEYLTKEGDKDVSFMYVWTKENIYKYRKEKEWELLNENPIEANLFKKIPVVYLSQENPEWWEVQDLIDNYEVSFSKFIDTNRYFSSPKYKATGKLKKSVADSKVVELDVIETDKGTIIKSDLEVISWDRAPEALKLEFETTKDLINGLSNTVDFAKLTEGGYGQLSGTAIKLMFLGPILKAKESEGDYQVVISRVISLLKSILTNIKKEVGESVEELRINATFTSVLPESLKEIVEVLSEALGGKQLISKKTAMKHVSLVENVEEELDQITSENQAESINELGDTVM